MIDAKSGTPSRMDGLPHLATRSPYRQFYNALLAGAFNNLLSNPQASVTFRMTNRRKVNARPRIADVAVKIEPRIYERMATTESMAWFENSEAADYFSIRMTCELLGYDLNRVQRIAQDIWQTRRAFFRRKRREEMSDEAFIEKRFMRKRKAQQLLRRKFIASRKDGRSRLEVTRYRSMSDWGDEIKEACGFSNEQRAELISEFDKRTDNYNYDFSWTTEPTNQYAS